MIVVLLPSCTNSTFNKMEGFSSSQRSFITGIAIFLSIVLHQSTGCQDSPVGIADSSIIPDDRFTSSSYYGSTSGDTRYEPKNARLNGARGIGWGPSTVTDPNDYLQIDLGQVFVVCAVATQVGNGMSEWTKQYKISTSVADNIWTIYKNDSADKLFTGNTDSTTVVKNVFYYPVLLRYIRFIPRTYNNWKVLRVEAYGIRRDLSCSSLLVGIGSGKIPDSDMASSSAYNSTTSPSKARLNYRAGSSWCAAASDSSPYLQINLRSPYIICGIATQGDHMTDQWLQSYHLLTSNDGSTFTKYTENSQTRTFTGNFNSSTAVKNVLYDGTVSQYIRVAPTSYYGSTNCIRTELYGLKQNGGCNSILVGLSYSSIVPDHRFTASSSYNENYQPGYARLRAPKAWAPKTSYGEWLQIDLGSVVFVCAVATQGSGYGSYEWAGSYKIRVSLDNVNWNYYVYQENNTAKAFTGNVNKDDVVVNNLDHPIKSTFIRFYPLTYNNHPTMRVEVYGITSGCSSPVGLGVPSVIPDSQMTSSSNFDNTHTASHGRLYGNSSWCSSTSSNTEYIQINLGQVMTVTGIATQGDHTMDKWVMTYTISYSMDGNLWNNYKAGGNTAKIFQGNTDRDNITVLWLRHRMTARHVRVTPQTWNTAICLRIELYGCDYATRPVISGLTNQNLTAASNSYVDLVCIVQDPLIQYIKWYTGNNDITNQSTGLVRGSNGVKQSTLRVNYTSDADVINNYDCFNVAWESCYKPFVCRTMYGKIQTDADGIKGAWVKVGVAPSAPLNLRIGREIPPTAITRPQVQLTWDIPAYPNGEIKRYIVYYGLVDEDSVIKRTQVKGAHTYLNLDVFGGKKYWFRVRGGIVKDGDDTPKLQVSINVYAPTDSPRALSASKRDSSTFVLSWQPIPHEKANGPIIKYEIEWSKITQSKPTINNKMVNSNQSETTIGNLEECSRYIVSIRGHTKALPGEGPYSKPPITISTSGKGNPQPAERSLRMDEQTMNAPSAPKHLSILDKATVKREVVLQWKEPSAIEPIEKYAITFRGTKEYNNSFLHSEERVSSNSLEKFQVVNLYPDTSYKFQVSAITRCGGGEKSDFVRTTTKIGAPPAPLVNSSIVNITSSTVKITLWPASNINGRIRKYQVIVKEIVSSPPLDATELSDHKTAKEKGLHYYVTAEINDMAEAGLKDIVVGDEKRNGNFDNVKLDENKVYEIAERALTGSKTINNEGKEEWNYFPGPMSVIARSPHSTEKRSEGNRQASSKSDGTTLYVAFAITGTLGLIIILLLVWNCRLRSQNKVLKACERISSRSKNTDCQFENAVAMQDRQYSNKTTREPTNPDIITDDVYEQIDRQWRPETGGTSGQSSRIVITPETVKETVSPLDQTNTAHPSVPVDDDEYADIDETIAEREKEKALKSLIIDGVVLDAAQIQTKLNESTPDEDDYDYQDMHLSAEDRRQKGSEDSDSRVYANPESQTDYQSLNTASDSEYKGLHGYGNVGFKSHEQDESFT